MDRKKIRRAFMLSFGSADIAFVLLLMFLVKLYIEPKNFRTEIDIPGAPKPANYGVRQSSPNKIMITLNKTVRNGKIEIERKIEFRSEVYWTVVNLDTVSGKNELIRQKTQIFLDRIIKKYGSASSVDLYVSKDIPFGDIAQVILTVSLNPVFLELVYKEEK